MQGADSEVSSQSEEFIARLTGIVGRDHVLTSADDLARYSVDWTGRYRGTAYMVVSPGSTEEVAGIVRACRDTGTPIVPQGGNTGLVGGSVPLLGEIVLSTRRFTHMGEIDPLTRQITVGAGVTIGEVQSAAHRVGLRYAVDFGARDSATVGGSIGTNAGGISVLRYGMTRRHVVGVEAVLGTGDVVSHLGGLVKDNTGYDIAGLLCGSEGTLGIVTEARLQLVPSHSHRTTALVGFASIGSAMEAVGSICSSSDEVDALEIFLEEGVQLVRASFDRTVPFAAACYLLIEMSSHGDRSEWLAGSLSAFPDVVEVAVATSEAKRAELWQLREDHTPAINTLGPPIKFDVSVPVARLSDFAESVRRRIDDVAPTTRTFLFGHAADGNLHVNISGVDLDTDLVSVIERAVLADVVRCGGSISAEHGIGTAKKEYLSMSRSRAEIEAMRALKNALDPDGIMNPNVLFD